VARIRPVAIVLASAGFLFGVQPAAAAGDVVAEEIRTQYEVIRVVRVAGGLERP